MSELYFVRHCEPERVASGSDNFSRRLTPKGLSDTAYVTDYLEKNHVSVVISSPYLRAVQTVSPFARKHNLRVEKIFDLSERRLDIVLSSENFIPFIRRQWLDFNYREADGECLREVQNRCIAAVEDILERYPIEHVAIGSHGTALCTIINYYYPQFGFPQFMQLVDIMPFIAHLSFYGRQCERIEIIDPLPFTPPRLHERTGQLALSVPGNSAEDLDDFVDLCEEFTLNKERLYGCMLLERFDDIASWQKWKQSDAVGAATNVWFVRRRKDNKLVGVMSLDLSERNADSVYSNVYVSIRQSERWKGYGAELIQTAKQYASAAGLERLLLVCDSGNIPSRRAIESAGGTPVNMLPAPFELYESGLSRRYLL